MATRKFGTGKEAMSWLLRGEEPAAGKGGKLEREIAQCLTKPPRTPKAPRVAKGSRPRASSRGTMTKAQYLASLPAPLSLRGDSRVSTADVVKRIRSEIAGAITAGALPAGTKVSTTQDRNSIDVDLMTWPGQVFVNRYTEHLMDPSSPWDRDYRVIGDDPSKRSWDPRLTDDLNRAVAFLDKLRERHNYDASDISTDYFNVGYYGRTSADPVIRAAETGIKAEANKEFADLLERGRKAAAAVGPKATKSICGTADLRSASQSCLERLIKVAERAKGRPVEYDASRRGWFPVSEEASSAEKITLGAKTYAVAWKSPRGDSYSLAGPRGGHTELVQNVKRPELWAHMTGSGTNTSATWYRRNADGSFTRY